MKMTHSVLASAMAVVAAGCSAGQADAVAEAPTDPATPAELHSISNMPVPAKFTKVEGQRYMEHMEMTPVRPPSEADIVRARVLIDSIREAILMYKDSRTALDAGYQMYEPDAVLPEYHFSRYETFKTRREMKAADPASLLYRKDPTGNFVLIGAMYTLPATASMAALDSAIPFSVGRWHRHVNWCFPPANRQDRWKERRGGNLVFGVAGVMTRAECRKLNGVFRSDLAGWMIHALVFAGDDMASIWGGTQMGMSEGTQHSH